MSADRARKNVFDDKIACDFAHILCLAGVQIPG